MVFIEKYIGSSEHYNSIPRSIEQLRPQAGALQKLIDQARVASLNRAKLLLPPVSGIRWSGSTFFMPLVFDSFTVLYWRHERTY
jgi:hypothetical protein